MGSVDDDVCPNATRRLPRILPVAFFFSALLATCAAILSLSFMPVACVVLLDHTYRAWPPQALQKLRQLIFRRPARETIQANARRAQQVGLWKESMGGRGSQVKSSQVKSGRGHEEEAWRCGGHEMVSTRIEQTRIEGLPLTTSHVHSVVDSVADDIVALLR